MQKKIGEHIQRKKKMCHSTTTTPLTDLIDGEQKRNTWPFK